MKIRKQLQKWLKKNIFHHHHHYHTRWWWWWIFRIHYTTFHFPFVLAVNDIHQITFIRYSNWFANCSIFKLTEMDSTLQLNLICVLVCQTMFHFPSVTRCTIPLTLNQSTWCVFKHKTIRYCLTFILPQLLRSFHDHLDIRLAVVLLFTFLIHQRVNCRFVFISVVLLRWPSSVD